MTERLGIEPTEAVEKGEKPRPAARASSPVSCWVLASAESEGELAEHLLELLNHLEPVRDAIETLVGDGYSMDWWCSVESLDTERAIELSPALLGRLAVFPGPLLIDAWTVWPDE